MLQIVRGTLSDHFWRPLLLKAGLPYRNFHATRHTFATWLLDAREDPRRVQQWLGHATLEQTIGTYSHCQIGQGGTQAQKALDGIIDGVIG